MLIQHASGAFKLQKEVIGKGRGERFSVITIDALPDEKVPGKDLCIVEAWLHTSASQLQDKPVATRQYYAAETGQAAANSLH